MLQTAEKLCHIPWGLNLTVSGQATCHDDKTSLNLFRPESLTFKPIAIEFLMDLSMPISKQHNRHANFGANNKILN